MPLTQISYNKVSREGKSFQCPHIDCESGFLKMRVLKKNIHSVLQSVIVKHLIINQHTSITSINDKTYMSIEMLCLFF